MIVVKIFSFKVERGKEDWFKLVWLNEEMNIWIEIWEKVRILFVNIGEVGFLWKSNKMNDV